VIERQKYTEQLVSPPITQKLERYRHRWESQQARWLNPPANPNQSAPRLVEFIFHNTLGWTLSVWDSLTRAGFEFLPLPWLRVYRLLKSWIVHPPSGALDEKTSLLKDGKRNWPTILAATALLGLIAFIQSHANPHLMFLMLYAIPCAMVALVVNLRWATLFVLACSLLSSRIQYKGDADYQSVGVFFWNFFSYLTLMEISILIIGRIRKEFSEDGAKAN
jgi:hypothetical protein